MNKNKKAIIIYSSLAIIVLAVVAYLLYKKFKNSSMSTIFGTRQSAANMSLSQNGLNFIKKHEGLSSTSAFANIIAPSGYNGLIYPYKDGGGVLTIGYGHTKGVYNGQNITVAQAEAFLKEDVKTAENIVKTKITARISQNAFDALVSYVFNTGGSSNLFKLVNGKETVNFQNSTYTLEEWWKEKYITANGILQPGLITRRKEEYNLFIA